MIKIEIILLTNNVVFPFHNLKYDHGLEFTELNRLYATRSLAEHGLGFLINVYDVYDSQDKENYKLIKKIIFDTGGPNLTFLHNLDVRGYTLYDVDYILLSHWHYDHVGALYKILEKIEKRIPIISHDSSKYERFHRRSRDLRKDDLLDKRREEILHLLSESKIINQEPINVKTINNLNGEVIFTKDPYELLNSDELKLTLSGEIPRIHNDEDFDSALSLQDDVLKTDKILDDKCLIFEFKDKVILLNGCCHSGLKNTLDYVKQITNKPISHIIGGLHMAGASDDRIKTTIKYLRTFQEFDNILYIFPIHCSGEKFIREINKINVPQIKGFNLSVGTVFTFY